jgi:hypothetical protein
MTSTSTISRMRGRQPTIATAVTMFLGAPHVRDAVGTSSDSCPATRESRQGVSREAFAGHPFVTLGAGRGCNGQKEPEEMTLWLGVTNHPACIDCGRGCGSLTQQAEKQLGRPVGASLSSPSAARNAGRSETIQSKSDPEGFVFPRR